MSGLELSHPHFLGFASVQSRLPGLVCLIFTFIAPIDIDATSQAYRYFHRECSKPHSFAPHKTFTAHTRLATSPHFSYSPYLRIPLELVGTATWTASCPKIHPGTL